MLISESKRCFLISRATNWMATIQSQLKKKSETNASRPKVITEKITYIRSIWRTDTITCKIKSKTLLKGTNPLLLIWVYQRLVILKTRNSILLANRCWILQHHSICSQILFSRPRRKTYPTWRVVIRVASQYLWFRSWLLMQDLLRSKKTLAIYSKMMEVREMKRFMESR